MGPQFLACKKMGSDTISQKLYPALLSVRSKRGWIKFQLHSLAPAMGSPICVLHDNADFFRCGLKAAIYVVNSQNPAIFQHHCGIILHFAACGLSLFWENMEIQEFSYNKHCNALITSKLGKPIMKPWPGLFNFLIITLLQIV